MTMRTFFVFFKKGTGYIGNAISQSVNIPPVMDCCRNVIILVTLPEVYIFQWEFSAVRFLTQCVDESHYTNFRKQFDF